MFWGNLLPTNIYQFGPFQLTLGRNIYHQSTLYKTIQFIVKFDFLKKFSSQKCIKIISIYKIYYILLFFLNLFLLYQNLKSKATIFCERKKRKSHHMREKLVSI